MLKLIYYQTLLLLKFKVVDHVSIQMNEVFIFQNPKHYIGVMSAYLLNKLVP